MRAIFLVGTPHASNAATLRRSTGLPLLELPPLPRLEPAVLDAWLDEQDLSAVFEDEIPATGA